MRKDKDLEGIPVLVLINKMVNINYIQDKSN